MPAQSAIARLFAVPPAITAEEVRATRASACWSLEETADLMEVLPLEVAAWEAGTITPTREQAATLRWHAVVKADEVRALAAGVTECEWMSDRHATVERLLSGEPDSKAFRALEREVEAHVSQCPACQRGEAWRREHPLPPHPDQSDGMETTLGCSVALLMLPAIIALGSHGAFPVLEPFLALFVGVGIFWKVVKPTRPLAEEHPVAANCLRAAAVVIPLLVLAWLRGWITPGAPESWAWAGDLALMAGILMWAVFRR